MLESIEKKKYFNGHRIQKKRKKNVEMGLEYINIGKINVKKDTKNAEIAKETLKA